CTLRSRKLYRPRLWRATSSSNAAASPAPNASIRSSSLLTPSWSSLRPGAWSSALIVFVVPTTFRICGPDPRGSKSGAEVSGPLVQAIVAVPITAPQRTARRLGALCGNFRVAASRPLRNGGRTGGILRMRDQRRRFTSHSYPGARSENLPGAGSGLAARAIDAAASLVHERSKRRRARWTRLLGAAVDPQVVLVAADLAGHVAKVLECRAAVLDAPAQNQLDSLGEPLPGRRRQSTSRQQRVEASFEAGLERIDVADPRDRALIQERVAERTVAAAKRAGEGLA